MEAAFARVFETDVSVMLMATGTAANGLALACMTPAWGEILCHQDAHVMTDECGGPEQWTEGAKITPLPGYGGKIAPATLRQALEAPRRGIHSVKPAALSLTNLTECGTAYSGEGDGGAGCHREGPWLKVHLDGARFSTRPRRIEGLAGRPHLEGRRGCAVPRGHEERSARGRGRHLLRQGARRDGELPTHARRPSALEGPAPVRAVLGLAEGRSLARSRAAGERPARRLAAGLAGAKGVRLAWPVEGNEVFAVMPEKLENRLLGEGFRFYRWRAASMRPGEAPGKGEVLCRLVCSWRPRMRMWTGYGSRRRRR